MTVTTEQPRFGPLLRRPASELGLRDIAQALRVPVTTLGDVLRRRNSTPELTPSQAKVLSQLSAGDALTVSTLAQAQDLAASSMTEVVVKLSEAQLVLKAPSPEDRREVRVSITKEGRRHLARTLDARTEVLVSRLELLTEAERLAVVAALPALWRLAGLNPDIWPRVPERDPAPRRPPAVPTAGPTR